VGCCCSLHPPTSQEFFGCEQGLNAHWLMHSRKFRASPRQGNWICVDPKRHCCSGSLVASRQQGHSTHLNTCTPQLGPPHCSFWASLFGPTTFFPLSIQVPLPLDLGFWRILIKVIIYLYLCPCQISPPCVIILENSFFLKKREFAFGSRREPAIHARIYGGGLPPADLTLRHDWS